MALARHRLTIQTGDAMLSTALRQLTAAAAVLVVACLIGAAAAVSAHHAGRHPVQAPPTVPAVPAVRRDEGPPADGACARLLYHLQQALDALSSSWHRPAGGG
jgi:hypothetical protein